MFTVDDVMIGNFGVSVNGKLLQKNWGIPKHIKSKEPGMQRSAIPGYLAGTPRIRGLRCALSPALLHCRDTRSESTVNSSLTSCNRRSQFSGEFLRQRRASERHLGGWYCRSLASLLPSAVCGLPASLPSFPFVNFSLLNE
jgi:hypothetical protein